MLSRFLHTFMLVSLACLSINEGRDETVVCTEPVVLRDDIPAGFLQTSFQQNPSNVYYMKLSLTAGVITPNLAATKEFYTGLFGFKIVFESDWFLLMSTADGGQQVSFLQPDHPSQQQLFQAAFNGRGMYLTLEVEHVEEAYRRIKNLGVPIQVELREEPWGDHHFAITDPNGIGVDVVTYSPAE